MLFRSGKKTGALAWLALCATAARAQYSTPVGSGAAKPATLRATAVLEWTGTLEKPNASRLVPVAIWDGEHYQPAGLYLARPDPLALAMGTQYELERSGEPAGLFNVRGAAELHGEWIGMGRFEAEAAPPPPPKLKVSKKLPVLSDGKPDSRDKGARVDSDNSGSDRPTLHRKTDESAPPAGGSQTAGSASGTGSSQESGKGESTGSSKSADAGSGKPAATTAGGAPPASSPSTSSSSGADPDPPTLHRRSDSSDPSSGGGTSSKTPDVDPDRPTLHRHPDAKAPDSDPDRPTLHRASSGGDAAATIDPDRPHLRYGRSTDAADAVLPARLEGAPAAMQQIVAVSDAATGESRPYQYHWASPNEAAKMQSALAALAAQAVLRPKPGASKPSAQFGPASKAVANKAAARKVREAHSASPAPGLLDEHFVAYELSFSGGATLVYSAHTADEGAQRVYVTLIAQPDFSGQPQVLLQQVARGDRLDETPAMQLVDAVDTDNDQRAELIFQLNGAARAPVSEIAETGNSGQPSSAAAVSASVAAPPVPEREFAIYRVANGKAVQVFNTGPLP